jgi:murein DD-endopeptidase MepM/ murein hydrolase activator NlpD
MRARATDHRGWTTSRRSRIGSRFILLLLVLSSMGGLFTSATPGAVRADELEDAYSRQERLQNLIDKQKESIKNLTANQAVLQSKISGTKATLAQLNANLLVTKTQIVGMTVDIARSQNAVDELDATGAVLEAEIVRLEAETARKEVELAEAKALLAQRIREAYDTDRTPMLTTFLSGDDFTDVLTEVGYQLEFAEQDKILADQIVEDQKVLDVLRENVALARKETAGLEKLAAQAKRVLNRQLAELRAAQKVLLRLERETQRLLEEQRATYERMVAEKAELQQKLHESHEAEERLEKLINKLVREMFADGNIPAEYKGSFSWPMEGVVTQEFGCTGFGMEPPLGSCPHFHRGIDIAAPMYTPIRAAGHGKVVFVGQSPWDPAWIVIIAHSQHLVSWYGHIDNRSHPPKVKEGQYVAKGQVIAFNGLTGWTTGPHVHWAVQMDETWVNPRLFLPR